METFEILKLIDSDLLGINAGLLIELLSGNKDIGQNTIVNTSKKIEVSIFGAFHKN